MVSTFGKATAPGASAGQVQSAQRCRSGNDLVAPERHPYALPKSQVIALIDLEFLFSAHRLSDRQRPGSRFRGQLTGRSGDVSEQGNGDLGRHLVFGCEVTER